MFDDGDSLDSEKLTEKWERQKYFIIDQCEVFKIKNEV